MNNNIENPGSYNRDLRLLAVILSKKHRKKNENEKRACNFQTILGFSYVLWSSLDP